MTQVQAWPGSHRTSGWGHFRSHLGQGTSGPVPPFSLQGPAWVLTTYPNPGKGPTPAKGKISEGVKFSKKLEWGLLFLDLLLGLDLQTQPSSERVEASPKLLTYAS